ncbi:Hairy/enhancer-of-split with YRPW motif protein 2 [Fusarium equiseti]|uniref:Sugar phosphate phosphatase n=1 Tax=Fusarium equiseti TaxID=61235 RepID=A0ABQ8RHN1_FUSEQ|nr:Hairy/enhancer-of-split with YRPW motif protein 2 [Fusarium equiseti]
MVKNAESVKSAWTSDKGSMASKTSQSLWPKIVQYMIDNVSSTSNNISPSPRLEELKSIRGRLESLQTEIINGVELSPLDDDGSSDIGAYNQQLDELGGVAWLNCPWLYGECYLYRRVQLIFSMTTSWREYDVFNSQNHSILAKSQPCIEQLAIKYIPVLATLNEFLKSLDDNKATALFLDMINLTLWGNAADFSLTDDLSFTETQALHRMPPIDKMEQIIVDNDALEAWEHLRNARETIPERRVDMVLDKSGFELFTDLIFAAYLIESDLATSVTLHTKALPWFVSNATSKDVHFLLDYLQSNGVTFLVSLIKRYIDSGVMSVEADPFWTTAFSFHEMKDQAPMLFQRLQNSHLTILKGDLNYRKLTKDGLWPHTTPFKNALGCLGQESQVKVLALSMNRSDTSVGIESEEKVESLDREAPGKSWVQDGTHAVVSFSNGL